MALDVQRNWNASMADDLDRMRKSSMARNATTADIYHKIVTAGDPGAEEACPFFRPDAPKYHLPLELLDLILTHVTLTVFPRSVQQTTLHACSLVSPGFYAATLPFLYTHPFLAGNAYLLFLRTICPSINLSIRRSPLAHLVRSLDLSLLVHQGTKSTTARLLGRTKESLRAFIAPQASFSLTCFPALAKCRNLQMLDLSLVSDAPDMTALLDAIAHLPSLREMHLPRSAGHPGQRIDASELHWPRSLHTLFLAGGIDSRFWYADLDLPPGLTEIGVTHVPTFDDEDLDAFLEFLSRKSSCDSMALTGRQPMRLRKFTVRNCPRLNEDALDHVLAQLTELEELSVSLDYVTPELLDIIPSRRYVTEFWGEEQNETTQRRPPRSAISAIRTDPTQGTTNLFPHQHPLQILELTDSGDTDDNEKFTPIDLLVNVDDEAVFPRLRLLRVQESLGWHVGEHEAELNSLEEWLLNNKRILVRQGLISEGAEAGVEVIMRRRR